MSCLTGGERDCIALITEKNSRICVWQAAQKSNKSTQNLAAIKKGKSIAGSSLPSAPWPPVAASSWPSAAQGSGPAEENTPPVVPAVPKLAAVAPLLSVPSMREPVILPWAPLLLELVPLQIAQALGLAMLMLSVRELVAPLS